MSESTADILKRMRHDLEERGVLGGSGDRAPERKHYTVRRSALVAYKKQYGVEHPVPEGAVIIEDL